MKTWRNTLKFSKWHEEISHWKVIPWIASSKSSDQQVQTSSNRFYKHVQTCSSITIRFAMILQTCVDLFKYYDTIWYNSTNMSMILWYHLIRFYKHVQTCSYILRYDFIRFYKHVQTCPWWYDLIRFLIMSRHDSTETWWNTNMLRLVSKF